MTDGTIKKSTSSRTLSPLISEEQEAALVDV